MLKTWLGRRELANLVIKYLASIHKDVASDGLVTFVEVFSAICNCTCDHNNRMNEGNQILTKSIYRLSSSPVIPGHTLPTVDLLCRDIGGNRRHLP